MSQVKLTADSGGGTVAIKAPASTTGNAALEMTVPSTASGTLDTLNRAGNILQVVSVAKTDVASTTSTSWTDITGFSAAITPSSSSNKILVTVYLGSCVGTDAIYVGVTTSDGTAIIQGDTVSGAESPSTGAYAGGNSNGEGWFGANSKTIVALHSPNTTSSFTYKMRWYVNSGTGYLNRNQSDSGQYAIRVPSTITLMEVAA